MSPVRPDFKHPPVVEQAITLMFAPIEGFSIGDVGLFWSLVRDEFPVCQTGSRLKPAIETFEGNFEFQITLSNETEVPRAFFRDRDANELLQLQNDRFAYNWMRSEGMTYPRHKKTTDRFWELFSRFESFLDERGLSRPRLQQCELINVNIAPLKQFGGSFAAALKIFNLLNTVPIWPGRIELEAATVQTHYVLKNDADEPIGRLHFEVSPVRDAASGEDAIRFDLIARGSKLPLNRRSAEEFFHEARDYINSAFLRLTTDEARDVWGERS